MDSGLYFAAEPSVPPQRVLAALGPKMLELAAERSQGTIPYLAPVAHTAISRAALPDSALVCPVQALVLDDDRDRARDVARRYHVANYLALPNYTNNLRRLGFGDDDLRDGGSDRLVDALVACGPAAVIRDRVEQQFAAGADHVCVQVIDERAEAPLATWRTLADALSGLGPRARPIAPT
jgi:probable F420-dependent oxidoreductase